MGGKREVGIEVGNVADGSSEEDTRMSKTTSK